ncbi:uncharacterized protein CCOS01_16647 [Colletotrichum costaricense]|uniref:Uncharacterized protein n=1 Tax=Colletotrichum costaricense TaxID=1209916 RepID=A0AAJ0DS08_9PEZI|nr:uncharacterized protein CCOS01_16647 [Colletotrichum costaricense]KAK1505957.1 hypothetical protein CCOS01_16647 [Colletotrichum costaricense]
MRLSERPRPPSHPRPHPVSCVSLFAFCFFWYEGTETWSLGSWESGTRSMEVLVYGVLRKSVEGLSFSRPLPCQSGTRHLPCPVNRPISLAGRLKVYSVLRTSQCDGCFARDIRYGSTWRLVSQDRSVLDSCPVWSPPPPPRPPETPSNPRPKNTRLTCLAGNSAPSSETVAGFLFRRHRVL